MELNLSSSEELDITVEAGLADLEKALLQVKNLRYQIYSKYLSEKLNYETRIRQLENQIIHSSLTSKNNTQGLSLNDLRSSREPFAERSVNTSSSTQTTEDKAIQTIHDFFSEKKPGPVRAVRNRYDENLYSVVEQLEHMVKF